MARLVRFEAMEALAPALAGRIAGRLAEDIATRGAASLVCSGGSTPGPVYDALSRQDLDWSAVQVTGSDERWLPPDDPASLDCLLHARLLRHRAASARFVPLKTADAAPEPAEAAVNARLAAMPRPFSLTLLGMGADGHTASLFPGAEGLARALDLQDPALARAMRPVAAPGSTLRMSLTLRALLNSRLVVVLFRGEEKLKVRQAALTNPDPASAPISAVLAQTMTPVETWWAP